ncbi:MAG: HDOD domain-containing protein [Candidatus Solibacter sp.]|nr:HDOD domain-containing protein [Candidatus Solibacter sp.]
MESLAKHLAEATVYLGRQPYELLYRRSAGDTTARFQDADQASAEVMLKAFLEIGLHTVSPLQPVFINHTRHLLAMDPILPADRCVIEVLEDVVADPETLAALRRLKDLKYRIALDDFVYAEELIPMIELADYVKLDLLALGAGRFQEQFDLLRRFDIAIIAEKIESEAEFRWCRKLGCALFQGYYLRRPEMLSGRRIPSNRLSVLSLLSECANLESSASMIAATIERDAPLTYGLLRLANSALHRRRSEIRSPAQAVMMLGMDFVSRWATLLVLAGNDDCPAGYLEAALQRARISELIGASLHCSAQEAYITGLLSTLDSVFNEPLASLVEPLPIDIRFKRALLQREGALGAVLDCVLAYESGEWTPGGQAPSAEHMQKAFWDAADYARQMIAQMSCASVG